MTTNFPTGLDTFSPSADDAVEAIEKVLVGPVVANVKGFGAVGDGVANDTAAIQAAIDSAASVRLYFPKGTYKINAALTKTTVGTLMVEGTGVDSVKINQTVDSDVFRIAQPANGSYFEISNLTIAATSGSP